MRDREARCYDGDALMHRTRVPLPSPPTIALAVERDRAIARVCDDGWPLRNVPTISTVIFDRTGVEVDLTGTWIRYDRRRYDTDGNAG